MLLVSGAASAQYIFLDANGDGANSSEDCLKHDAPTTVDVWLVTNSNRDGSAVRGLASKVPMSVFSYEFVLRAEGGEVEWGEYENLQRTMTVEFKRRENPREVYVGYGGLTRLEPGRYRLGRLRVNVMTGNPSLRFASEAAMDPSLWTSFGSENPGIEEDHTIRFGPLADNSVRREARREWSDSDGIRSEASNMAAALQRPDGPELHASIVQDWPNGATMLRVSTTRQGPLKASLFDVRGRLVGRLIEESNAMPGVRSVELGAHRGQGDRLPSGIYFYRVSSVTAEIHGKVVLLH